MIDPTISVTSKLPDPVYKMDPNLSQSIESHDYPTSQTKEYNDFFNQMEDINSSLSKKSESILESIHRISTTPEINMSDLIHVQYQIAELALQEHTVMKVSEKSSDCLNALYKHQ